MLTTASPLTVLVAEDEPAMLNLVMRHMKSLGFSLFEAPDGDTAWKLAQQHHPDLVILDVMMPGMSGWEVCKRLKSAREGDEFAATGVIMLTGIGENLNEMTSPLYAADAWLNKPYHLADLERKIAEVLERYGKQMPPRRSGASHKPNAPQPDAAAAANGAHAKKGGGMSRVSTSAAGKAAAPAKARTASKVRTSSVAKKAPKPPSTKTPAGSRRSK